ncbi:MAG TPA: hypothetical protein VFP15_06485 [Gemmatimonadaceae bacterium]|nr:hypothetical protein [Gemmatimonadaceae bacterium]
MKRLFSSDTALLEGFTVKEEDDDTATFTCKGKDGDGEPCPRVWNVDVNADGTLDRGIRNALLAHAKAHSGGFSKMRRIS